MDGDAGLDNGEDNGDLGRGDSEGGTSIPSGGKGGGGGPQAQASHRAGGGGGGDAKSGGGALRSSVREEGALPSQAGRGGAGAAATPSSVGVRWQNSVSRLTGVAFARLSTSFANRTPSLTRNGSLTVGGGGAAAADSITAPRMARAEGMGPSRTRRFSEMITDSFSKMTAFGRRPASGDDESGAAAAGVGATGPDSFQQGQRPWFTAGLGGSFNQRRPPQQKSWLGGVEARRRHSSDMPLPPSASFGMAAVIEEGSFNAEGALRQEGAGAGGGAPRLSPWARAREAVYRHPNVIRARATATAVRAAAATGSPFPSSSRQVPPAAGGASASASYGGTPMTSPTPAGADGQQPSKVRGRATSAWNVDGCSCRGA